MTDEKYTEELGLTEAGISMSEDIYWKELRGPITRQEYTRMQAYD
jgi:hypothetical protein